MVSEEHTKLWHNWFCGVRRSELWAANCVLQ